MTFAAVSPVSYKHHWQGSCLFSFSASAPAFVLCVAALSKIASGACSRLPPHLTAPCMPLQAGERHCPDATECAVWDSGSQHRHMGANRQEPGRWGGHWTQWSPAADSHALCGAHTFPGTPGHHKACARSFFHARRAATPCIMSHDEGFASSACSRGEVFLTELYGLHCDLGCTADKPAAGRGQQLDKACLRGSSRQGALLRSHSTTAQDCRSVYT